MTASAPRRDRRKAVLRETMDKDPRPAVCICADRRCMRRRRRRRRHGRRRRRHRDTRQQRPTTPKRPRRPHGRHHRSSSGTPWPTISVRWSTSWSPATTPARIAVQVNATFQGTYDDTYNALLASFEAGTAPNIIQNFDLAAQTMFDTGELVPAYELMEPASPMRSWRRRGTTTRTRTGWWRWPSTPARPSCTTTPRCSRQPVWMRLRPTGTSATSWPRVKRSRRLACEFCVTFGTVGWYFEQILANSGGLYFNNDNGRTGTSHRGRVQQGTRCRGLRLPHRS